MNDKMEFRMITQYLEKAVFSVSDLLKKEGFEICDLRESAIVSTSDGTKECDVYILQCKGREEDYEKFKHKHQLIEIDYEGFKTLM